MTQYTIHEPMQPPGGLIERADATRFVKEGMAWWALVLPLFWLLYHRMWLVLLGFILAVVALETGLYLLGAPDAASTWASILFSIVFAMHANDLRRWTLSRRGFAMVSAVSGQGRGECELKYFSSWPAADAEATSLEAAGMAKPAPRAAPHRGDEVIGLFPDGR